MLVRFIVGFMKHLKMCMSMRKINKRGKKLRDDDPGSDKNISLRMLNIQFSMFKYQVSIKKPAFASDKSETSAGEWTASAGARKN